MANVLFLTIVLAMTAEGAQPAQRSGTYKGYLVSVDWVQKGRRVDAPDLGLHQVLAATREGEHLVALQLHFKPGPSPEPGFDFLRPDAVSLYSDETQYGAVDPRGPAAFSSGFYVDFRARKGHGYTWLYFAVPAQTDRKALRLRLGDQHLLLKD